MTEPNQAAPPPEPASIIDESAKAKILAANVSNIVRKVKAGKPLTAAELKLVEGEAQKTKYADTLAQAASMCGYNVAVLKWAKRSGCPAFRHSRVYVEQLKTWLEEHKAELENTQSLSKEQADIRLKILRHDREAWEWEVEKRKFWKKEDVAAGLTLLAQFRRATLQRKLEAELPPKLVGLDVIGIQEMLKRTVDEICQEWEDATKQWTDPK